MTTTTDQEQLTDMGPATQPPPWCLPGTVPCMGSTNDENTLLWTWSRDIGGDVWISCDDYVIDGRVMRSEPKIEVGEMRPCTVEEIRVLAEELIAAENILRGALEGAQQ